MSHGSLAGSWAPQVGMAPHFLHPYQWKSSAIGCFICLLSLELRVLEV